MEVLGALLLIASFVAILVFIILILMSLAKKNGKTKRNIKFLGISVVAALGSFIIIGMSTTNDTIVTTENTEDSTELVEVISDEEKAASEKAAAKAEAEAAAKEEAEQKAAAEKEAQELEEKINNAQSLDYLKLKKNPDRYAGEYVKYSGEIVEIQEGDNFTIIRLAVTKTSYGYDFNDIVFVNYPGYTDYVDEDIVTVYGVINGSYSYTSQAGWEITVPSMIADKVE